MNVDAAFLIVGLGNPGAEYNRTRHNAGFMVLDELAARHKVAFNNKSKLSLTGQGLIGNTPVLLAKPLTYMNLSGQAVVSLRSKYGFTTERLLVISDDFCLPLGRLRVRKSGGTGGHNGLRNITECLGTKDFARLRLGIGASPAGQDPINFVLGKFRPEEHEILNQLIQNAADAVEYYLENGCEATMNKFNGT